MVVTHHGYNILKMPGSGGIIIVPYEERDAVCSLERAFQAAAIEDPDNAGTPYHPEAIPKKKKQLLHPGPWKSGVPNGTTLGSAPATGAPPSIAYEGAPGALLGQGSGDLFSRASDLAKS